MTLLAATFVPRVALQWPGPCPPFAKSAHQAGGFQEETVLKCKSPVCHVVPRHFFNIFFNLFLEPTLYGQYIFLAHSVAG